MTQRPRDPIALNAKTPLDHVECARFPAEGLSSLASLRRIEGISVLIDGGSCWVFWPEGESRVLRALLPVVGVELFERKGTAWHRWGRRLPSFDVPDESRALGVDRALFPEPFEAVSPEEICPIPATFRLVREGIHRPSTATVCPLFELALWADQAPSRAIESIRGVVRRDRALLLGNSLPFWPGAIRYWGERVLRPLGQSLHPRLPEAAILEALGLSSREMVRFVAVGIGEAIGDSEIATAEVIPIDAFRPLTRAGVRLARRALTT